MSTITRKDLLEARQAYAAAAHKNLLDTFKQQITELVLHEARLGKVDALITLARYPSAAPQPPPQIGELPRPELSIEDKINAVYTLFPDISIQKEEMPTKIYLILNWAPPPPPSVEPNQPEPRS